MTVYRAMGSDGHYVYYVVVDGALSEIPVAQVAQLAEVSEVVPLEDIVMREAAPCR